MEPIRAEGVTTARLDLLPLRVAYAEEMAVVLSDPRLHAFIGGAPASPQELRERYVRLVAGAPDPAVSWCNWVVRLRDEVRTVVAHVHPDHHASAAVAAAAGLSPTERRHEGEVVWEAGG